MVGFWNWKEFLLLVSTPNCSFSDTRKVTGPPYVPALTGCDTVSGFVGHGKQTAWSTWNAFPELTDALLELAHVPMEVTEQIMKVIERFIVLVDKARKKMFSKPSSVQ